MQQTRLPLPVGTTDFKRICRENYYVDKTLLIKDLLDEKVSNIFFCASEAFWQDFEHGYAPYFL